MGFDQSAGEAQVGVVGEWALGVWTREAAGSHRMITPLIFVSRREQRLISTYVKHCKRDYESGRVS